MGDLVELQDDGSTVLGHVIDLEGVFVTVRLTDGREPVRWRWRVKKVADAA